MQEELKRCNTIGDARGILYFTNVVISEKNVKREAARQLCSFLKDVRINFSAAVALFEFLGLISVNGSIISTTEQGFKLVNKDEEQAISFLCKTCLEKIIGTEVLGFESIHFDPDTGYYYIPKHGFPLAAASFRNFLIQLKAIDEQTDGKMRISPEFESVFEEIPKEVRCKTTLEELKRKLAQQEEQGEAAEKFVVAFEKKRLQGSSLINRIKQISHVDVSAGYDIVSYEDCDSVKYNRFIEVKSYDGAPHFYWSKNEMEVARLNGDKYFIYLVDMRRIAASGYSPQIIQNPSKVIVESDDWIIQPSSYLVFPIE